MMKRPDIVDAKVYKLDSAFINQKIYITLSFIIKDDKKYPIEIFINSKDLKTSREFTIISRLMSAIFRNNNDVSFIIEELSGIYDPDGIRHKGGKSYPSIYSEIAEIIQSFFTEINYTCG